MDKLKINFFVDLLFFISFLILTFSGFFMKQFRLGINLREIHIIFAWVSCFFALIHIILHIPFIKNIPSCFKDKKKK